jgi:hypothetical protein
MKMTISVLGQIITSAETEMVDELWLGKGIGIVNGITRTIKDGGFDFAPDNSEMILVDYNIK